MTAPERIYAGPDAVLGWDYITAEHKSWPEMCRTAEYILATPAALAASPEVQALVMAERERCATLVESTAYTSSGDGRRLEPVSAGLVGMDMHHATIAAAIRAGTEGGE